MLLVMLSASPAGAQGEREVARRVHETGGYADRLNVQGAPGDPSMGPGSQPMSGDSEWSPPPAAPAVAPAATGLSYLVIGIAVVVFIVFLVFVLASFRPRWDP